MLLKVPHYVIFALTVLNHQRLASPLTDTALEINPIVMSHSAPLHRLVATGVVHLFPPRHVEHLEKCQFRREVKIKERKY